MFYIDSDLRKSCEEALLRGDFRQCLERAKAQIVENDLSEKNLQRIAYYLAVKEADPFESDTTPSSPYYKLLIDQGFKNPSWMIYYTDCLRQEGKTEEVKKAMEEIKTTYKDPYMKLIISRPMAYELFENDQDSGIAEAMTKIQLLKDSFPNNHETRCLYRTRAAYFFLNKGDTLSACRQLDTAFNDLFQTDKDRYYSELTQKKSQLGTVSRMIFIPVDSLYPITKKIADTHLQLAADLYRMAPSLYSRLLYLYALQNQNYQSDTVITINNMQNINSIFSELVHDMPSLMYPKQLGFKYGMIVCDLVYHAHPDSLERHFAQCKAAWADCKSISPYFYAFCLDRNYQTKAVSHMLENNFLLKPLDAFNDELLTLEASLLGEDSLDIKCDFFHTEAKKLYKDELYSQSLSSYDKASRYYEKKLPDNDSYLNILDIFLQKGDAYLALEQYQEAYNSYQQVLDYGNRLPASLKVPYLIRKGQAYYFQGDIFSAMGDYQKAYSYFDKAEKEFKQAQKAGDTTFYGYWGEMHYNKALLMYQQQKGKQCIEELQKAEALYETYPMRKVSNKYENLKDILIGYYKENNNRLSYVKSLTNYMDYCDSMKYNDFGHYQEYINTAILLGDFWNTVGWPNYTIHYYKTALEGKDFMEEQAGEKKDLQYLRLLFAIGKNYRLVDSLEQAISYLKRSGELNHKLFYRTEPGDFNINDLNVKSQLALCYEAMEDSTNNNQNLSEALTLRKDIVARLSQMDSTPALKRNLAFHHRKLGILYINMDRNYMAADQFDTTIAIILPMYRDGDKEETEGDLAWSYLSLAYLENAAEDEDEAAVKSYLLKCMDICENAADRDNVLNAYYNAVSMMLQILENPLSIRNESEIKKYRKLKAALEKELSKK